MKYSFNLNGLILQVAGYLIIFTCLIMFSNTLSVLDMSYTASLDYTEQLGLTNIISVWGIILYITFLSLGLAMVGFGTALNVKKAISFGGIENIITTFSGGFSIMLFLLLITPILSQIHALYY